MLHGTPHMCGVHHCCTAPGMLAGATGIPRTTRLLETEMLIQHVIGNHTAERSQSILCDATKSQEQHPYCRGQGRTDGEPTVVASR